MPKEKQKIIAIVGPTASGKSALGVALAKALGGEVISADSRQVYRGLNLGTGKITKKEARGVPHHLIDVAAPARQFSADDFVRLASNKIAAIYHKNKLPIVVGGTGFYTDALLGRLSFPNVPPNQALRARLAKKSPAALFAMLKELDPARAATIEPHHARRLIRAIEIATALRRSPSARALRVPRPISFDVLWLGLYPGEQKLRQNIHARLTKRMKAGMLAEVRRLHARGLSFKRMRELGLEYRFLAEHLTGAMSKEELEDRLERAIARYAKRQMRWLTRNHDIRWLSNEREALKLAREFIASKKK